MAQVTKRNGHWVADFKDQDGKRRRERPEGPFENMTLEKIAAQELLTKRQKEIAALAYHAPSSRLTFDQLCDRFLTSKVNVRHSTTRSYTQLINAYLRPYFADRKIHQINAAEIERFRAALTHGLPPSIAAAFVERRTAANPHLSEARAKRQVAGAKPGVRTINKVLTLMVMMFNYAEKHRWVDHNPASHVEKIRAHNLPGSAPVDANILSPTEVKRLIEAAQPPRRDADGNLVTNNYRLLIELAVFTGMRQGEIFGVQWGDVDWPTSQLHVRRSWKEGAFHEPKTKTSARRVDIPKSLLSELRAWRLACPKGLHDLIFPNLDGRPMSHANLLQRGFYPALRRAGLRKIRFHDLRHTFASLLLANGTDVVRVSRMLGHASPAITLNVYSHMLPKEHYGDADALVTLVRGVDQQSKWTPATAASGARVVALNAICPKTVPGDEQVNATSSVAVVTS